MREALQQFEQYNNGCDAQIFAQVKEQYKRKRNSLKCKLEELFKQAIVFGSCKLTVTRELDVASRTIDLCVVLEALQALGWLEERVDTFTEKVRATIFEPILKRAKSKVERSQTRTVWVLECEEEVDAPAQLQPTRLFGNILAVVNFLAEVFEPVEEVVAHAGRTLWTGQGLCSTVIEECMMKSIPDTEEALEEFRPVVQETKEFEHQLLALEFIGQDQLLLTGFMGDLDRHYVEKKRRHFLTQARSLIVMDGNYSTVTVGEQALQDVPETAEGLFRLPQCKISTRAKEISSMVRDALEEAAGSPSPQNQAVLYGAARDVLDLFRAIVVARHASTYETVPSLCAVFHNDCIYLAHLCLTLGHEFKARFQAPLSQTATFVDMVPAFRQLAERYFGVNMDKQRQELDAHLTGTNGLMQLEDETAYGAADKAMMQVRHLLSQLGRIWCEVLPAGLYLRSIGSLIDHVAAKVLRDTLALEGMPQSAVSNLSDIVACFVEGAQELLKAKGGGEKEATLTEAVPCWHKLEAMKGLLEVVKAPAHYVHGARRGQLMVLLTNVNQAFEEEDSEETVRRLVSFDDELALSLVQKMREYATEH